LIAFDDWDHKLVVDLDEIIGKDVFAFGFFFGRVFCVGNIFLAFGELHLFRRRCQCNAYANASTNADK